MKYSTKNQPLVCMLTQNVCYKNTGTMQVKGICWHDTASNNTYIKRYVQPSDNDPKKMKDSAGKVLGSFKPGHYYNMTLLVHSPEKITITVSIEDWKNGFNPDAEGSADDYVQDLDPLESEE